MMRRTKTKQAEADPLKPSFGLLIKLGSLIVHLEEFNSPNGHPIDKVSVDQIQSDPEVLAWRKQMDQQGFLPKKREGR